MAVKLKKVFSNFVKKTLTEKSLDDAISELKLLLYSNDVAVPTADEICDKLVESFKGEQIGRLTSTKKFLFETLKEIITEILTPEREIDLIKEIKKNKRNIFFSPVDDGDITVLKGNTIEIRLEYNPNYFYMEDVIEEIFMKYNIEISREACYIKLFEIEKMFDENFLEDMMYSCPKFPKIKLGNIGLLIRKEK